MSLGRSYKLFFKYIFFNIPYCYSSFSRSSVEFQKSLLLVIPKRALYYLTLHVRFGTMFYSTQLSDLFGYELPLHASNRPSLLRAVSNTASVLIYNFHNMFYNERYFFFCVDKSHKSSSLTTPPLTSISELFSNAGWLEREVAELQGTLFNNKRDLRNLMLQYGDSTTPFRKSSPSIGLKEVFYDSINDVLIQTPVAVQV